MENKTKMAARLNFRQGRQRLFLFSSLTPEMENSCQQKVEKLGGQVVQQANKTFSPMCTHVIAEEFAPTEKLLGALAGGKWLLNLKYIHDSYRKGYWLKEEEYEFTNFGNVAAYHRQRRELKNNGLYYGWKVLVLMDSPSSSRTFKRILTAGEAEVASKDDIKDIDFVLTKKELVKYAQESVSSLVPLVDVSYIKNTLIFKAAPMDLKACDLRAQQELEASKKAPASTASKSASHKQDSHTSARRPTSDAFQAQRNQTLKKLKQTTLTQHLKPVLNRTPQKEKRSEEKCVSVEDNDIPSVNSSVSSRQCDILAGTPVMSYVEDEPQIIGVIRRRETEVEPDDIRVVNKMMRSGSTSKDMTPKTDGRQQSERKRQDIMCCSSSTNDLNVKKCSVYLGKKLDVQPSNKSLMLECKSEQFKRDSVTLKQFPMRHSVERDTYPEQIEKEAQLSKHVSRRSLQCNLEKFPKEVPQELPKEVPPAMTLDTLPFTITKHIAKKLIVNFLKTRQYLNEVCGTSVLLIPTENGHYLRSESEPSEREIDPQQILDVPNYNRLLCGKHRELTAREMNLYTCFVADGEHDQELNVHGLDTLLNQVSAYLYPPPAILGKLLRNLALETPFQIVHSRALRVAYRVLCLHPPHNTKMRQYYTLVLEAAMQPEVPGNYNAWKFIKRVIHCALPQDKGDIQDAEREKRKALRLLEFLNVLITEDAKNSLYGKSVEELLTWKIFWGSKRTCSVLPPPVKQLLHLWMFEEYTSFVLRSNLAQLVSVLLELMWKLSETPLVPVTALPDTLAPVRMEFGMCIRGLSRQQCLEVIRGLHTPWAQCVVSLIILQEVAQYPQEMALSDIVDFFHSTFKHGSSNAGLGPQGKDCKTVSISPSVAELKYHRELSSILANSYLEVSANRFIFLAIKNHIGKLKNLRGRETEEDSSGNGVGHDGRAVSEKKKSRILDVFQNEILENLSVLEEAALSKIYTCIKLDKAVHKRRILQTSATLKKIDEKNFFWTLCL